MRPQARMIESNPTAACSAGGARDLASSAGISALVWGIPAAVFLCGFFTLPASRTFLWAGSLLVAGVACVANALRCGRLHCYFTGTFFLAGAAVVLADSAGVLPLGPNGWAWTGATMMLGGVLLTVIPELLWGKYRARSCGRS